MGVDGIGEVGDRLAKDMLLGCKGQVLQQGVDGIGEVGDRASKGQAAGVYGAGFPFILIKTCVIAEMYQLIFHVLFLVPSICRAVHFFSKRFSYFCVISHNI